MTTDSERRSDDAIAALGEANRRRAALELAACKRDLWGHRRDALAGHSLLGGVLGLIVWPFHHTKQHK